MGAGPMGFVGVATGNGLVGYVGGAVMGDGLEGAAGANGVGGVGVGNAGGVGEVGTTSLQLPHCHPVFTRGKIEHVSMQSAPSPCRIA